MKENLRDFLRDTLCPLYLEQMLQLCTPQDLIQQWKLLCALSAECWTLFLKKDHSGPQFQVEAYWKNQIFLWAHNPSECLHPILKQIDLMYKNEVEKILYEISFSPQAFGLKGQRNRWIEHLSVCHSVLIQNRSKSLLSRWLLCLVLYQHSALINLWSSQNLLTWQTLKDEIEDLKITYETQKDHTDKREKILYYYGLMLYKALPKSFGPTSEDYHQPSWMAHLVFRFHSYYTLRLS